MPAKRISMRKIKEVLRLRHAAQLSYRKIAGCTNLAPSTVREYVRRSKEAGLTWPLPEELGAEELERMLFPNPAPSSTHRPLPDWASVHRELRRKGVTLMLLWQEYKAAHPEGYQYSRYCDLYRSWRGRIDVAMRQSHRPGEKLFVDYAGQTIGVVDPETGEVREAQIFVAVLGASNYTYAEATWTQQLPDWTASHVRSFSFFGGTPEMVVCDNLRSGVAKTCRYEPDINPTYQDLAMHYGVAVLPARSRAPRDKAKVEAGVLLVERWILAALRNRTFFSLEELNEAIGELLDQLNEKSFQKLPGSRCSRFEKEERSALGPLPPNPYEYAEWKKARVSIDYHIEVERHYYSVPYRYAKREVDVRITALCVEIYLNGKRIASHVRSGRRGMHTTIGEHMPPNHRAYADWTPQRIYRWAAKTGPETERLARRIIASRAHPQQGYRSCLGIFRLEGGYGAKRLEEAARRANAIGATSYKSVASILKNGLDGRPLPHRGSNEQTHVPIAHDNIRGASYYAREAGHAPPAEIAPLHANPQTNDLLC